MSEVIRLSSFHMKRRRKSRYYGESDLDKFKKLEEEAE